MQEEGCCGWLYRVIQPGFVSPEPTLKLLSQNSNAPTVKETFDIFFGDPLNKNDLLRLVEVKTLSASWTQKIELRLKTGELEDWTKRLYGA